MKQDDLVGLFGYVITSIVSTLLAPQLVLSLGLTALCPDFQSPIKWDEEMTPTLDLIVYIFISLISGILHFLFVLYQDSKFFIHKEKKMNLEAKFAASTIIGDYTYQ